MKNLNELLQAKEQEFAVLVGQKESLEQELQELVEKHDGSESDMRESEQAGLMDRFKKALRLKKDLSKEIEDTQDTLEYITQKIVDQKNANDREYYNTVKQAFEADIQAKEIEVQPEVDKINELLEQALAVYDEIKGKYAQFNQEATEKLGQLAAYAGKEKKEQVRIMNNYSTYGYNSPTLNQLAVKRRVDKAAAEVKAVSEAQKAQKEA